jgi:hypothetical protein
MDSMETTCPGRVPFGKKSRKLAIGVLAAATLSIPVASAVTVTAAAFNRPGPVPIPVRISPDSHRLALSQHPDSLRLT